LEIFVVGTNIAFSNVNCSIILTRAGLYIVDLLYVLEFLIIDSVLYAIQH